MSFSDLSVRAKDLQNELNIANATVQNLTNQLNQASIHLHTINGRFHEVAFLLHESQKGQDVSQEGKEHDHSECEEEEEATE